MQIWDSSQGGLRGHWMRHGATWQGSEAPPRASAIGAVAPGGKGKALQERARTDAGREDGGAIGGECGRPKATNVGSVEGWVHPQG